MSQPTPPPSFVNPNSVDGRRRIQAAASFRAHTATNDDDDDAEPQTPAVKPTSTTASKMSDSFKKSVQRLTALSNLKKNGTDGTDNTGYKVELPTFIQNLPLFTNNSIDVKDSTLTGIGNTALSSLRSLRESRGEKKRTSSAATPPQGTATAEREGAALALL